MSIRSLLPPRRREWTPGTMQLGLFIRDEQGRIVETTVKTATRAQKLAAYALLRTVTHQRKRRQ